MKFTQGFIYCATGKEYVKEANISIRSLKQKNNIDITVFTDKKSVSYLDKTNIKIVFIDEPKYSFYDKIYAIMNTPYDRTLFLDTDTYILSNLDNLFILLDRFDLAASHAPGRTDRNDFNDIPKAFSQFNTGVVLYKKKIIEILCKKWKENYNNKHPHDQYSFRKAVYNLNTINCYVLTPEYNFRMLFHSFLNNDVKIIHDHDFINLSNKQKIKIIEYLNRSKKMRLWNSNKRKIIIQNRNMFKTVYKKLLRG